MAQSESKELKTHTANFERVVDGLMFVGFVGVPLATTVYPVMSVLAPDVAREFKEAVERMLKAPIRWWKGE